MKSRHRAQSNQMRRGPASRKARSISTDITPESALGKLDEPLLASAIGQWEALDLAGREKVMDAIFVDQRDLLLSVLTLMHQGHRADLVEMLLQILGVAYLAATEGGYKLTAVSESEVIQELERVTAQIKFTEGLTVDQRNAVIRQYFDNQGEHWLAAYGISLIQQNRLLASPDGDEREQTIVLMAYALLGCLARALNGPSSG